MWCEVWVGVVDFSRFNTRMTLGLRILVSVARRAPRSFGISCIYIYRPLYNYLGIVLGVMLKSPTLLKLELEIICPLSGVAR